jgi:hypothetical protein
MPGIPGFDNMGVPQFTPMLHSASNNSFQENNLGSAQATAPASPMDTSPSPVAKASPPKTGVKRKATVELEDTQESGTRKKGTGHQAQKPKSTGNQAGATKNAAKPGSKAKQISKVTQAKSFSTTRRSSRKQVGPPSHGPVTVTDPTNPPQRGRSVNLASKMYNYAHSIISNLIGMQAEMGMG